MNSRRVDHVYSHQGLRLQPAKKPAAQTQSKTSAALGSSCLSCFFSALLHLLVASPLPHTWSFGSANIQTGPVHSRPGPTQPCQDWALDRPVQRNVTCRASAGPGSLGYETGSARGP